MRGIRNFTKTQRVGLFIGAVLAILVLVAHNPFNGYRTEEAEPYEAQCGSKACIAYNWYSLDFTEWKSKEPLVPWLGNLVHFLSAEAGIAVLIALWIVINSENV